MDVGRMNPSGVMIGPSADVRKKELWETRMLANSKNKNNNNKVIFLKLLIGPSGRNSSSEDCPLDDLD